MTKRNHSVACLLLALVLPVLASAQERSDFGRVFGDDLTKSIKAGDYDGVYRAMVRGYNPGKRYVDNKTPLMLSAVSGSSKISPASRLGSLALPPLFRSTRFEASIF